MLKKLLLGSTIFVAFIATAQADTKWSGYNSGTTPAGSGDFTAIVQGGVNVQVPFQFGSLNGQAALTQLPTLAANRMLGSIAGGTPIALTPAQILTLSGAQAGPLTGDVTTSGAAATLANTAVTAASYTFAGFTVDSKGRLTGASNGSISGTTGQISISGSGGSLTLSLPGTITQAETFSGGLTIPTAGLSQGGNIILNTFSSDTLVGIAAGANLPGTDNVSTAVGYFALNANNCVTSENTAIGWETLKNLTACGAQNTAVGVSALSAETTGTQNTAIGTDAMKLGVGNVSTTAIGADAMHDAIQNSSVAIGLSALTGRSDATSVGAANVAIGNSAMGNNVNLTTASFNVAIGNGSYQSATTGTGNMYLGYLSGNGATSGSDNAGVGYGALGGSTTTFTGGLNTAMGYEAGFNVTSAAGNTLIGAAAGLTLTSGGQNIIIGYLDYGTLSTGSNNIIIANSTDAAAASTSNTINIGNIITVLGTNTPSTSAATFAGTLNVVGAYNANGTAGVTCASVSAATMTVKNGIITHC